MKQLTQFVQSMKFTSSIFSTHPHRKDALSSSPQITQTERMTDTEIMALMAERMRCRQRALKRMADDMAWLIRQPSGSLHWTSTQRDLVEMVHIAWQQGTITDAYGNPMSQQHIAQLAFAAMGLKVPKALTHIVCCLDNRQDARRSIVNRYMTRVQGPEIFNQQEPKQ